jgi:hypothetical protein
MSASSIVPARHDPYLTWAFSTGLRHVVGGRGGKIRLAGELRQGCSLAQAVEAVSKVGDTALEASSIAQTSFFTATMMRPTIAACDALREYADFVLAEPGMKAQGATLPQQAATPTVVPSRGEPPQAAARSIVVGIVDSRCGFASEAFCDGSKSRLTRYWDQEGEVPPAASGLGTLWTLPHGARFGRELDHQALNAIAGRASAASTRNTRRAEFEKGLYQDLGHQMPADADWSHGSHVLGTVLGELLAPAETALIYVQLPELALRDSSARWSAAYVLDAIDYILNCADKDAKVIINLSLGAFAGPHDGSSLLERALGAIAEKLEQRVTFVIAAGNAGKVTDDGTGQTRRCHAQITLKGGASHELLLDIDRADDCESFVELWARSADGSPGAGITVSLTHTDHASIRTDAVAPDRERSIEVAGAVVASVINATGGVAIPNGAAGLVLVALGDTRGTGSPCAPMGRWSIQIANPGLETVDIDAWIERRDMPGELAGYRPQYGFAADTLLNERSTLATLANSKTPIVVGAIDIDASGQYGVADYSSRGPSLRTPGSASSKSPAPPRLKPDVYALGQRKSDGFFTGATKSLAGTSVAAACVTAAVASALADPATPPGSSARDALARLVQSRWNAAGNVSLQSDLQRSEVVLPR